MKKVFKLEDLDCANCAAKLERAVNELPEVKKAMVNFMLQKMTVEVEDGASVEELTEKIKKVMKKVVPDCRMI